MTYVGDQLRMCALMTTGANMVEAVVFSHGEFVCRAE